MSRLLQLSQHASTIRLMIGIGIVSALCAYLGVFILLRREQLASVVLAQVTPLGIALALFLSGLLTSDAFNPVRLSPQLLAFVLTIVTATLIALPHRERRPRYKTAGALAWLAVGVLAIMAAASWAIVGVASVVHAKAEMIYLLFGNRPTITVNGLAGLAGLACVIGLVHRVFYKEFLFVSFDPDMATALGMRTRWWNILLLLTIGVTMSLAIRAAGAMVVLNLLVVPAATALLFGRSLRTVFCLAIVFGVISGFAGITLPSVTDLPGGAAIVAVSMVLLLLTGLINVFRR